MSLSGLKPENRGIVRLENASNGVNQHSDERDKYCQCDEKRLGRSPHRLLQHARNRCDKHDNVDQHQRHINCGIAVLGPHEEEIYDNLTHGDELRLKQSRTVS